jgi:nitroreductase
MSGSSLSLSSPLDVARRGYRAVKRRYRSLVGRAVPQPAAPMLKSLDQLAAPELSSDELRAFMRHDAHRIEKAFYNRIFDSKRSYFDMRRGNVFSAFDRLVERGEPTDEPTVRWAKQIADEFERLEETFIGPQSRSPEPLDLARADEFLALVKTRRSVRLWADQQPTAAELETFAMTMIEAGTWAPNSGNRQPWRFRIITDQAEKDLLKGLKEEHCYNAPCLIFVGMDSRFYGALGENEAGLHVDAGAAIMLMKLCAHAAGFGVCWNHFCRDLLESRPRNGEIYSAFASALHVPEHVEPVAILAFGRAASIPPVPARQSPTQLLIS